MTSQSLLENFYSNAGEFFIIIRSDGIIVVEDPRSIDRPGPPEALLRLFPRARDAVRFLKETGDDTDTRVMKTTLVGLWTILGNIDSLSRKWFNAPVRVEVAAFSDAGEVITVDTLRSYYSLPC
jgi:hypothetical protein